MKRSTLMASVLIVVGLVPSFGVAGTDYRHIDLGYAWSTHGRSNVDGGRVDFSFGVADSFHVWGRLDGAEDEGATVNTYEKLSRSVIGLGLNTTASGPWSAYARLGLARFKHETAVVRESDTGTSLEAGTRLAFGRAVELEGYLVTQRYPDLGTDGGGGVSLRVGDPDSYQWSLTVESIGDTDTSFLSQRINF